MARATVTRLEAHLADVRAQNAVLAAELAERRREAAELRALVGIVAQATRALPDPARRSAAPEAPERASSPDGQPDDQPPSPGAGSWWRRAWAWLTAG